MVHVADDTSASAPAARMPTGTCTGCAMVPVEWRHWRVWESNPDPGASGVGRVWTGDGRLLTAGLDSTVEPRGWQPAPPLGNPQRCCWAGLGRGRRARRGAGGHSLGRRASRCWLCVEREEAPSGWDRRRGPRSRGAIPAASPPTATGPMADAKPPRAVGSRAGAVSMVEMAPEQLAQGGRISMVKGSGVQGAQCPAGPSPVEREGRLENLDPSRAQGPSGGHKPDPQSLNRSRKRYGEAGKTRRSAATATLLSLALVLLRGGLVVAQPLQVGEDACLRHLALEAPQGGFNPFVLADSDLGHKNSCAEANSSQS